MWNSGTEKPGLQVFRLTIRSGQTLSAFRYILPETDVIGIAIRIVILKGCKADMIRIHVPEICFHGGNGSQSRPFRQVFIVHASAASFCKQVKDIHKPGGCVLFCKVKRLLF